VRKTSSGDPRRVWVVSSRPALPSSLASSLDHGATVEEIPGGRPPSNGKTPSRGLAAIVLDDHGVVDPEPFIEIVTTARRNVPSIGVFLVSDLTPWGEDGFSKDTLANLARALVAQVATPRTVARCVARFLSSPAGAPRNGAPVPEAHDPHPWIEETLAEWVRRYGLTEAEARTIELSVRGQTNKEIAHALDVAPSTVHTHLVNLSRKLEVTSRGELAFKLFDESHARFGSAPRADDGAPDGRAHVLLVCENNLLRARTIEALHDASESLETAVADRTTARSLLRHGSAADMLLLDLDQEPSLEELVATARSRTSPPRIIALSMSRKGASRAEELGLESFAAPFEKKDLLAAIEQLLAARSKLPRDVAFGQD